MARAPRLAGRVTSFDDAVGLGEVTDTDGVVHGFHCTRIADGSRTIAVDTAVTVELEAGHRGLWEATDLRPSA